MGSASPIEAARFSPLPEVVHGHLPNEWPDSLYDLCRSAVLALKGAGLPIDLHQLVIWVDIMAHKAGRPYLLQINGTEYRRLGELIK